MRTEEVKAPIYIMNTDLPKTELLNSIADIGINALIDDTQSISNTDWMLGVNFNRPYFEIIQPVITKCLEELSGIVKLVPKEYWYQQYEQNDYHGWHRHPLCTYSSVYYVELPQDTTTVFRYMNDEFTINAQEGDYVVFPSYLEHCSKPNVSGSRKTAIGINLNIA